MNDLNMNRLPVPTWNQCGVNSAPKAAALPLSRRTTGAR